LYIVHHPLPIVLVARVKEFGPSPSSAIALSPSDSDLVSSRLVGVMFLFSYNLCLSVFGVASAFRASVGFILSKSSEYNEHLILEK